MGNQFAKLPRECHRLLTRVHVDDRLVARRYEVCQVRFAPAHVALVVELQIRTRAVVKHEPGDAQSTFDVGSDSRISRSRKRQHDR